MRVGGIVFSRYGNAAGKAKPLAIVFSITNVLEHAAMALLAFRFLPGLRLSRRIVDRETLHRVKGYSIDAFLAMLAGRITVQTGAIVVGGFLTVAAAAHYAIAARLVELAKNLLRSATTTLTPAVSEREASGDFDGVRRVLLDGTRWVLYLVLPIHLGMLFFGKPFLTRWIGGPEYAEWCFPAVAILSATLTIGVAQSVASRILYGMGKLRLFARLALVEAAVNLVLSLVLVGPLGLVGVAIAVAVPNVCFCLFVIGYACFVLEVRPLRYMIASWLKPLCAACVPAAVWWCVTPADATWLGIALGIATGLVPFALTVAAMELAPRLGANRSTGLFASGSEPSVLRGIRHVAPARPV
ncbi:MAG: polysaccharide biosynthesis C-terminal domain-containing protein [Gemmataceae bacterium]